MTTTVVSIGAGNIASIPNMLRRLGEEVVLAETPEAVEAADRIILPGVGAFDRAMATIADNGVAEALTRRVLASAVPTLGICLGMQLLAESSTEGQTAGLGWLPATVVRLAPAGALPVPHMGWATLRRTRDDALLDGLPDDARFYFAHSYGLACREDGDVVATADYGGSVTAVVRRDNVMGTQFHPEKSHKAGLQLLANFLKA